MNTSGCANCRLRTFPTSLKMQLSRTPIRANGRCGPDTHTLRIAKLRPDLPIRAGDYQHVSVRVAKPDFSVLRCGVNVGFEDYLSPQLSCSTNDGVIVVNLEPEQYRVPYRGSVRVDEVWMMFCVPGVELKD